MTQSNQTALKREEPCTWSLSFGFFMLLMLLAAFKAEFVHAASEENHELIGKLWSVADQRFIDINTLKSRVLKSDHIIIGETHDNINHHKIQAEVLGWFIEDKKTINPIFEMLSKDQLSRIQKNSLDSSDVFFDKVAWEQSGWPDRKLYKPIFDVVLENNLPIYAAETERKVLMQLMKQGEANLPKDIAEYLDQVKLNEAKKSIMKEEIVASHCGMLPDHMVDPMILGQRVRDAVMAKAMMHVVTDGPTMLIAGSGHGRKDHGVPAYLKSRSPQASITTITMMEVVDDITSPMDYKEAWAGEEIPFDFVWFTARMERDDPCEELRQHFKHHPAST